MAAYWGHIGNDFGATCDACGWKFTTELLGADGVIVAATACRQHNADNHDAATPTLFAMT